VTQLSDAEPTTVLLPAQGPVKSYDALFKLLKKRKIPKVDKAFLQDHKIASGNERTVISGLKFLGLIDKEGNATEDMNNLCVVGEKRKENLAKVVRYAYSLLFDEIKIDLEKVDPDTLINTFKTDYKMGSVTTARRGAQIFVFLAQQAGISLSQPTLEKLSVSRKKVRGPSKTAKRPRGTKKKVEGETEEIGEESDRIEEKGMYVGRLGDSVFIKLRKSSDRNVREKIAKHAKTLIDMYVEEEESGTKEK